VAVHQLDEEARMRGRARTLRALRRFQYATDTGDWFGWEGQVNEVELAGWAYRSEERDAVRDVTRYAVRGWSAP
jgi:hypothetical protein